MLRDSQDQMYRQDKAQPYETKDLLESKRYMAQKVGTHYVHDWLQLIHQVRWIVYLTHPSTALPSIFVQLDSTLGFQLHTPLLANSTKPNLRCV
jgi:hypothetical protein